MLLFPLASVKHLCSHCSRVRPLAMFRSEPPEPSPAPHDHGQAAAGGGAGAGVGLHAAALGRKEVCQLEEADLPVIPIST
mmetsp:Transcript_93095/g.291350  ORF Transcript_93095/g.291350 Transcript_93095/m.291350 type:complete len:80 (+) Transcript_93095:295-534(+)